MVTLSQILEVMKDRHCAAPAFNVHSIEQMIAMFEAASAEQAPLILQVSPYTLKKLGYARFVEIARSLDSFYHNVPVCLHLDHALDFDSCLTAVRIGFTSIMIDGSYLHDLRSSSTYEFNLELTAKVSRKLRRFRVSVEGALGFVGDLISCIGSNTSNSSHVKASALEGAENGSFLTDFNKVEEFVMKTKVDALAVSIGNTHGINKSNSTKDDFDIARLKAIHRQIPNVPLVLHGGSMIPKHLVDSINLNGGEVVGTGGRSLDSYHEAIANGVRKINIDTDNKLAMTAGLRESLDSYPDDINPENYLAMAADRVRDLCKSRFRDFQCSGTAKHVTNPNFRNPRY